MNDEEVEAIAAATGKTPAEVRLFHTKLVGRRVSLTEHANGDCTFFDGQSRKCTIYTARPRQCRTWPFWNSNIETPEDWAEVREGGCPGAGQGAFVSLDEIQRQAAVIDM